ncbi:MAG TPA: DUF1223 domain-containing protein [Thermoanaerobaculia bacterium]|nr:DUF1223 domain-containing protein [Thermoanaerobaculia bacterium]
MRLPRAPAAALALPLLAALAWHAGGAGAAAPPAADTPVVMELFTSQGCSSCPAADRLLTRLGAEPELSSRLFPLAFHVDYWNHSGWTDPFSSRAWTERQRRYARELSGGRVYTPQLVVNGSSQTVGNDEEEVLALLREALARRPAADLHVRLSAGGPDRLRAQVTAEMASAPEAPSQVKAKSLELLVALYQKDLTTSVGKGENEGRRLENDYVVRHLERAGKLPAQPGATAEAAVTFALEPGWDRSDLGVVAFLQDPKTLAIHGAARATLEIVR